ncbi:MAG: hypothetical protein IID36_00385, partial [Planctomycetes bacterium]|nr:hypothetical protein [Planctomycetota bacterium]
DGWLFQNSELVDEGPVIFGEDDIYRRDIPELADDAVDNFFLEWAVETDGPQAFGAVAPCAMVAGGISGVLYHFTIAKDKVQLKRDSQIPLLFFDIEPDVPHTYRLELQPGTYTVYIDGEVVDAGVSEGPYPTADSAIVFGARAAIEASVTRWNFVRLGLIPTDASFDFDSDEDVDHQDYFFVHDCLTKDGLGNYGGPGAPCPKGDETCAKIGPLTTAGPGCAFADSDADGDVDLKDVAAFQNAFTGQGR